MLDILDVAPESFLCVRVLDQLSPNLEPRDRRSQIVRQSCQHEHALAFVAFDPGEHLIEALGKLANLARTRRRNWCEPTRFECPSRFRESSKRTRHSEH